MERLVPLQRMEVKEEGERRKEEVTCFDVNLTYKK